MVDTAHTPWRQIAWNGIRFDCPVDWEIGQIGLQYLMLETEEGPVLELKWNPVRGRFSHKSQLRRLAAFHRRRLRKTLREGPLPAAWAEALEDYHTTGFSWHAESVAGRGAIVYCPQCRNATLIQFFYRDSDRTGSVTRRMLASFLDHSQNRTTLWAVYDIRAEVPAEYKLKSHRFDAGDFELAFSNGKQQMTLHRWSPALILLTTHNLKEIASVRFDLFGKQSLSIEMVETAVAEGSIAPSSIGSLWKNRLQGKPPYRCIRLWHVEEKNRILCVQMEGNQPIDREAFNRICRNYESL